MNIAVENKTIFNNVLVENIIKKLFRNELFGPENYKSALIVKYLSSSDIGLKKTALKFLREILEIDETLNVDDRDIEILAKWWYKNQCKNIPFPEPLDYDFTFVDLFAGIGGFRLALQNLNGKCVFSSEWNKDSQKTYFSNFGEIPFGDITLNSTKAFIPQNFDVLCAGFPCQPFSLAGVSSRNSLGLEHGFNHPTQGNLFFEIIEIAKKHKPKIIFLENVKNLKSHDNGNTFKIIEKTLRDIGYSFFSTVINSQTVVPQRRERTYMVCFRDKRINFSFPEFEGKPLKLKSILEEHVPEKYTISDKLWEGHIRRTKKNLERGTGFSANTADIEKPSKTIVARYYKDGKECLIPQENGNPRMLTPRECSRLMGFPENYILPASDSVAYKQFGNSVAVPVIKQIAELIKSKLK
ncbi:DNA (cytosine-5-)-methyltransferase [Chryseobacterium sp. SIMBA_029]|uniref:DNA (cytosine-5-)-methyltransferase n=1 Tax=Chryseobacterium sp. SIMBA_029 TaxID=3085772 RepID=UPI003979A10A